MVIAVNQNLFQLQTLQKPLQVFKIDPIELNKLPSPTAKPKVLSQTPAAGTAMARGSKVNLVLVNGSTLPGKLVAGGLAQWSELQLGALYNQQVKDDALINNLITQYEQNGALSASEQTQLQNTLQAKGITLGNTTGNDATAAITTLSAARSFGG